MTHCASSLKRPCVGDVVAQVVDLELENKHVFLQVRTSQCDALKEEND